MVHNGIEYGLLQAYGEGFEILRSVAIRPRSRADRRRLAPRQRRALVAPGALPERASRRTPSSTAISGYVEDSGEGRWTVQDAIDRDVPAPVITLALFARFVSRQDESFAAKVIAALRNEFGGHAVKPRRAPAP